MFDPVGIANTTVGALNTPLGGPSIEAWKPWLAASGDRQSQIEHFMPNMGRNDYAIPFSNNIYGGIGPSDATRRVYQNYLSRDRGIPDSLAQSQIAQALAQQRPQQGMYFNSPNHAYGQYQGNPQGLAQSLNNINNVGMQQQQSYLQQAADIGAYNTWQTQQLINTTG